MKRGRWVYEGSGMQENLEVGIGLLQRVIAL
jgi:hypothetical protein